jgi:hypothetical protein
MAEIMLMPPQSTSPRWIGTTPASLLFLLVFLVATVCVHLWPDEGHVASFEASGIDADAVVASLTIERREHASLAAATTRAPESAATDAGANGETRPQSSGGKTAPDEDREEAEEPATTTPAEPVGEEPKPAKRTVTLPVIGETPLPEPEILDLPVPEVPAPQLPALPEVPTDPGALLP